jgi:hypothetical protein
LTTVKLYHGTIYDFIDIDIYKGKYYKDFGQGFYATQSYDHALSIAERNRFIELERLSAYGKTDNVSLYVYEYKFSMDDIKNLYIKIFKSVTSDWVNFVIRNRTEKNINNGYDLVIGATANDNTRITILNYQFGAYGNPGSPKAIKYFIKQIKADKLPIQWMFATEKSVNPEFRINL